LKTSLLTFALLLIARSATHATTLANFHGSMIYAAQTDAAGNIYVAGFQGTFTKADPFVAKLSSEGKTLYSTTFAGSGFGIAWAIAIDSSGAAYVFGNTNSPDFPVTPGALQTTMQGTSQGFVAKLDPSGKIVYSTFIGGGTDVTPGLTSAPGLDSILVDSAGDVILTGQAGTNSTIPAFPPPPALNISSTESFVVKLDPTGSKILAAVSGVGGMIAMDGEGNIYVAGQQFGEPSKPIPVTPGAFQGQPSAQACGALGAFFTCGYQYVAKLDPALDKLLYTTYLSGQYGATPAAISVDTQGNALVAGTTISPDYPTTPNAYEPQYIASAVPKVSCFFIINCHNTPPASGYLTEVNPAGTGLIYSSFFSGTETDTIDFAGFTTDAIYLGGNASSADLPGFAGYPQQCLPQRYETRLSPDGTEIGASHIAPGKILTYDAAGARLIATSGSDVVAFDPNTPQTAIACILDSADLQPVTAVAPGELLSLFGEFSAGTPATPPPGKTATSLNGVTVDINGTPSSLLYAGGEQINFQVPFGISGAAQANINFASTQSKLSDSRTLPIVASNPAAFLDTAMPSPALADCTMRDSASVNGLLPLAINSDGAVNNCLNRAAPGSVVTLFLNGVGSTTAPVVTATPLVTVAAVAALPGIVSGLWEVGVQIPAGQSAGGIQVSLKAGGTQVRDANLVLWVK
jgi:uncharacterized protein (TIGR03437 family)